MSKSKEKHVALNDIKVYNTFVGVSEIETDSEGFYKRQQFVEINISTDGYYRATSQGYKVLFSGEEFLTS